MQIVFISIMRGFAQLTDPAILRVLGKSVAITLAIFLVLGVLLWWLVNLALTTSAGAYLPADYGPTVAGVLALGIGLVGGWLLFRVVALAVLQFFADEVVFAVEARHYTKAARSARKLPLREDLGNSLRGVRRALAYNALALPIAMVLFFTAIGPAVIFLMVNAVLLGRELTDMGWLRHCPTPNEATPVAPLERLVLGGAVAGLMLIPFLNFLAPVIGAAAGTHMVQLRMTSIHD